MLSHRFQSQNRLSHIGKLAKSDHYDAVCHTLKYKLHRILTTQVASNANNRCQERDFLRITITLLTTTVPVSLLVMDIADDGNSSIALSLVDNALFRKIMLLTIPINVKSFYSIHFQNVPKPFTVLISYHPGMLIAIW